MEDRELFSKLRELGGEITPPEHLSPGAVGESLREVRRKRPAARPAAVCALLLVIALTAAVLTSDLNGGSLLKPDPAPVQAAKGQKNNYDTIFSALPRVEKGGNTQSAASIGEENNVVLDYGSTESSSRFTNTNEQAAGVQEGDIVKTDGTYLYAVNGTTLMIFKAQDGKTQKIYGKELEGAPYQDETLSQIEGRELFVSGDRLAVVCTESKDTAGYNVTEDIAVCGPAFSGNTLLFLYDISDRSAPKLLNKLGQSGGYLGARLVDGTLYVLSNFTFSAENAKKDRPETFVPLLTSGGQSRTVDSRDVSISKAQPQAQYTTVTSVNLIDPADFLSSKSVMGGGTALYCNTESLYLGIFTYDEEAGVPHTQLLKFALNGGKIELSAETEVEGTLLNQFAMDESNGYFRLVTSYTKIKEERKDGVASAQLLGEVQRLYVLDQSLQVCGTFENESENERLQSVRFVGDTAYFVTFEQTDPLFSVDLSDPQAPKLLSALKIPGFSQYLHPYGNNRLLGFGVDADENGVKTGLKLSMFDTSDNADVNEIAALRFSGQMSYSPAQDNHKAILFDGQNGLIGIPVLEEDSGELYEDGSRVTYYLFSYSEKDGFTEKARLLTQKRAASGDNVRGIVIGDYFYLCDAPDVTAYPLSSFI